MRVFKESQGVSIIPWLDIPPHCMNKGFFTLAPPTTLERSASSLKSKKWLQYPTTGASDVQCKYVSWNFCLITETFKANTFFMHDL